MHGREHKSARRPLRVAALLSCVTACVHATPVEQAMALARQHEEAKGITLLHGELTVHPDNLDARRLLIRLLAVESNLPAARDEIQALAERLPPDSPDPWIELGHALELMHQFDEAMAAYDTASVKAPTSPRGPREAGTRAARLGMWEEAKSFLEEAARRGGNDEELWHTLGLVRLNLHDDAGAREAYTRGTHVDPRGTECWLGLATLALKNHDWAGALTAYDEVLRRRPGWGDGTLGRAWALAKLGRREEAAKALDAAEEGGANPSAVAKQRALLRVP